MPRQRMLVVMWLLVTSLVMLLQHVRCDNHVGDGERLAHSIAFISITTDDLASSLKFYTEVLGGMQATEFSFRFHGNDHYELMFQKELQEARGNGVDPVTLGVPDITDSGTHEVCGEMIVFDNGLIQLIQFVPRDNSTHAPVFQAHETRTSPAYIGAPHICFWVQDEVDINSYIAQLENRSASLGLTNVKANRPVEVQSEAERETVPEDSLGLTFNTGDFAGLSFAYVKGPRGEQLELYRLRNQTRHFFGRDVCGRGAVATAYMDNYEDNQWKRAAGLTGKLFGLIQFGTRTDDLWRSVDFYVKVLGARLVEPPLQANNVRGDEAQNMLFQKELLDAAAAMHVQPQDIGIANISDSGNMRLDHRFNLFDNFVVEPLLYTDGQDLGDPGFNPRYNHSSLAYTNDMYVAFMVHHDFDFPSQLDLLERKLKTNGFQDRIKVNRISVQGQGEGRGHFTFTQGPLSGLTYSMLSGPAGEHVALVQFGGAAREKLKNALIRYGAVSTEFPETDPQSSGRMTTFCKQFTDQQPSSANTCFCTVIYHSFFAILFFALVN